MEILAFQKQLKQLLESQTKTVKITISAASLQTLKDAEYMLCFAKKVGDSYNVVWQSTDKYLENNGFSWTPQYQLFGSNEFQGGVTVNVSTNTQNCGLGEQCTLDDAGHLGAAVSGGSDTALTLINKYGNIHPGVNQVVTNIDGSTEIQPIYVAENPIVTGSAELTPKESVKVWFQQNIETSTMISDAISNAVELDLTSVNSAAAKYDDGKWSKV